MRSSRYSIPFPVNTPRFGVVLRCIPFPGISHTAVVHPHAIPNLAAQEPVDGNARRLASDVPQGHLDGAHGAAPGLERSEPADPLHHPLHVARIFTKDKLPVEENVRLEIGFAVLGLGVAVDALVGRDTHHGILPHDRTLQIGDLHRGPLSLFRSAG
jgi:hypothetical protein